MNRNIVECTYFHIEAYKNTSLVRELSIWLVSWGMHCGDCVLVVGAIQRESDTIFFLDETNVMMSSNRRNIVRNYLSKYERFHVVLLFYILLLHVLFERGSKPLAEI